MFKETHFHLLPARGWPTPTELRPYFFDPSLREEWRIARGLIATNIDPKELPGWEQPTDLHLTMEANPFHGVFFHYWRFGGGRGKAYYAKGDLRRMEEWVGTKAGDLQPVGLFVPFETGWCVVKEFIERDGALPECIEWLDEDILPRNAFPRWGFDGKERIWAYDR